MTTDDSMDICHSVKTELRAALIALLGVLSISTSECIRNIRFCFMEIP
jgi:hypothetical protein